MKTFYQSSPKEVRNALNGHQEGLTENEVLKKRETYGWNELEETKKKNVVQLFLEQFKDFLVIILICSAVISGVMGDMESAVVIIAVITMNAILGTVQTIKAEHSLKSLKKLSGPEAKVIRNGQLVKIPAREVVVGDTFLLEAGDCIPADGRIITNASLKVDESALSGESVPVEKQKEEIEGVVPLTDQTNMVFSGSFVTYGRGEAVVTGTGMDTEIGKIAMLLKNTQEKRTPLQINLDQFGQKLSILILVFCGILFGLSVFRGENIGNAFLFAVALAVAAIPEALSSIVTIVLAFGTQKMAAEHAIIRKLQAVEGLGSVSVVCSDKTGTLTQNKMTVEECYIYGKETKVEDLDLNNKEFCKLLSFGILCNDATIENGEEIGDPTETALISLGQSKGMIASEQRKHYQRVSELPFDSDRKLMSTLHGMEEGYTMVVKGAADVMIGRLQAVQIGEKICPITEQMKEKILSQTNAFSQKGLRVLAFAFKDLKEDKRLNLEDENNLIFLGLIAMMDPPREESALAVKDCKKAGIKPVMITGDHKVTAAAIAKRIGILQKDDEVCEGMELDSMTDEELQGFVDKISVYARVSPEHKIRIVRAWQAKGNVVAMTGDGVNDAPALKQADIGVAMGITGTEVSKDAAAMVLTDDNFSTIVKAVENGRNVYKNIKGAIGFLLSGNFGAILAVLFASIAGLPVPFAPVHLLFINLLTDSLPAIALGLEPHSSEVMNEKPRPVGENILTKSFLKKIAVQGLVIGTATSIGFLIGYKNGGEALGSTFAFAVLCLSRLVHGFNCKMDGPVIGKKVMFNNKYLQGAFLIGVLLLGTVLLVPGLHGVFKVASLTLGNLLTIVGLSLMNFIVIQGLKLVKK